MSRASRLMFKAHRRAAEDWVACGPEKLSELMRLAARANAFPAGANLPSLESLQGGNELSNLMEADNVMHALVGGEHGGGSPHAAVRAVFRGEVPEEQAFDLLRCVSSLKRLKQRNALASELRHCLQPKARGPDVLYNVGAVLRHLKFGWHGVVCGYDDTCAMPDPWLEQNYSPTGQKHDIEVVRRSPFYSLACNDGIHRYASQLTHELVEGNSASFFGLSESDVPEPPQLTGEKDRQFVDSVASALREGKPGFIADPFKIWLSPAQSKHMIARYFVGYSREDGTFLPNEHLAAKYPDP